MTNFTRKDYMTATFKEQEAAHRKYYAQMITPAVLNFVTSCIGFDVIKASTNPHFNDIPLRKWDNMEPHIRNLCLSRMGDINGSGSVNEYGQRSIEWSLSDAVCIAKEAARQIKEKG